MIGPPLRRLAPALALALGACTAPDREALEAVRRYDAALQVAFRTGDASAMRRVAGADEARRVAVLVATKAQRRVVLESTLETFEPVSVERLGPDQVRVVVRERWRYVDRPLDPGVAAGTPVESAMTMRYDLAREDGRLVVREVRTLERDGRRAEPAPDAGPPRPAETR